MQQVMMAEKKKVTAALEALEIQANQLEKALPIVEKAKEKVKDACKALD